MADARYRDLRKQLAILFAMPVAAVWCIVLTSSVGYASSSHFGVHFGLGKAPVAERVEILWPSGIHQMLTNVPANRVAEVREPAQ
jgi:hypothetical protein